MMNGKVLSLSRLVFLCALLCAVMLPLRAPAQEQAYSRTIEIEGIGSIHYYAQNDPLWARMVYEPRGSQSSRTMLSSGCAPTAAAIAIDRQLGAEELARLSGHTSNPTLGFRFCDCSVNEFFHYDCQGLRSPNARESFEDYLPVVIASYAAGNNDQRKRFRDDGPGTSLTLFRSLCEAYGLEYRPCSTWDEACEAMQSGCGVITSVTKGIFTSSSHYLYLAGTTGGYLYILDPFMREDYPDDTKHLLSVVEPGLVRVALEDVHRLDLYGFYAIGRQQENADGPRLLAQD
ncbi:MAG: hypothetical protein MR821_01075 [Clostridiales bacterium]|nr:hypothetical protein [Clostridiales bacterium]